MLRHSQEVDVVIIDIDTEEIDDVVEHFKNRSPLTRICALSSHTQGELMQHCLSAGADAYIVKDSSLQELVTAIKALGEGKSYVDPRVAASLLRRRAPSNRPTNELAARARSFGSSRRDSRTETLDAASCSQKRRSRITSVIFLRKYTVRRARKLRFMRSG